MGGLTRRPIKVKPVKPELETPRPKNIAPTWIDLEEIAFGKPKRLKNPKVPK